MKASTEVARILELPPPGLLQRGHLDATSGFPKVRCPHAGELNGWTVRESRWVSYNGPCSLMEPTWGSALLFYITS